MKLGSLKSKNSLDGELIVVSRDLKTAVKATKVSPSLREAIEHWSEVSPALQKIYDDLNSGGAAASFPVN